MKASISRREIIEKFDALEDRLTVITFKDGNRVCTYSAYNAFHVIELIAARTAVGMEVRVLIDAPKSAKQPHTIADVDTEYLWKPQVY